MKSYILPTVALSLLLYFLSSTELWAQTPPKFHRLTTADGLPSNGITAIFEDKTGFLWIGTDAGLARYDGKNMQIFQHQPDNKNSIADNTIYKITQDGKGNMWILTGTHLNQYDPVLQQWKYYPRLSPYGMLEQAILFADHDGNIWWLKKNEVSRDSVSIAYVYQSYRVKTGEIKDYVCRFSLPKQDTSKKQNVYPNLLEYKGELYAAGGFMKYDKARDTFVQIYAGEGLPYNLRTFAMTHDEYGNVYYFGAERGREIWHYDLNNHKIQLVANSPLQKDIPFPNRHYMQSAGTTFAALYDNLSRRIWLASFGGLVEIDLEKKRHFLHTPNDFDNFSLPNPQVVALFRDTNGNIWAGTSNGLAYFPSRPQFFHEYPRILENKIPLSNSNLTGFAEDNQKRIWVATAKHISYWNKTDYDTLPLPPPKEPVFNKSIKNMSNIRSIAFLENTIYAGTWGAGIYKINPDNRKAEYLSPALLNEDKEDKLEIEKPLSQSLPFIRQAKTDEAGNLWAIDWGIGLDLLRYNPRTQTFRRYLVDRSNKNCFADTSGVAGGQLMSFAISPERIYVGSEVSGLYQFDRKKLCFERRYSYDAANPKSISSNKVITVFVSKAGEVWAGTENGLNRLKKDGTFERFQNFPNNYIVAIEEDNKGFLWIATQNGLCRFNPRDGKYIYYNEHNGLQSGGFNDNAIFKSSSGEIYVGGANGFNYFHPDSVIARQKQTAPRVVLTHLKVMNKEYVSQDTALEFHKAITLAHDENDLQLTFAALDLSAPANNRYQYRLILKNDGWFNLFSRPDTTWISMGNNNLLNLPRVSFGEYVLEVRASAAPDIWSSGEQMLRLYLTVCPPFYAAKAFVFGAALLLAGGIFAAVRYRERKKRKELEQRNLQLQREVDKATAELREKNEELAKQKEEISAQAEELKTQNELIEKQRQELADLRTSQSHDTKNNYQRLIELIKEEIKYQTDPKAIESLEKIATVASIRAHLSRRIYEEQKKDATYRYDLPTYINEIIYELSSIAAGSNFDELQWSTSVENMQLQPKEMSGLERIMNELYHNAEKYLRNLPYAPHIHIAIKKTDTGWMFTYQDNGSGYPEAVLQKGASALADLYRTSGDLYGEMRIANNNGAYFELIVNNSTDNKQKRQQPQQA
ncbi:ligand-binding sensor domain-containing protein [Rhodoflexus caldus]|uniref:ligand-binding sensor domain-containing protein n=1 Tax=Rhodoflexus caldus TaxID=2891236 RepID=UPI00202A77F9|nr:two-component regulator propeller domain-containing protein [Rhodoflexus caldus]